jgi:hypothetical protein
VGVDHVEAMVEAGFSMVFVGIETPVFAWPFRVCHFEGQFDAI